MKDDTSDLRRYEFTFYRAGRKRTDIIRARNIDNAQALFREMHPDGELDKVRLVGVEHEN